MAFEIVLVDGKHHSHHFAGGLFREFVVFIHRSANVAVVALDAERRGDELH